MRVRSTLHELKENMVGDKYILGHFCILILFLISCTPGYYVKNHPKISSAYFEYSCDRLDRAVEQNPNDNKLLTKALIHHTQYAYGFIMEKADREVFDSYSDAINLYQKAAVHFAKAELYGKNALRDIYPTFDNWLKNRAELKARKQDIPLFYWTAAAIGGKISAGRGNPLVLIQLSQIKLFLEKALELNPEWNSGVLYSALFSYYLSSPSKTTETEELAMEFYHKALEASNGEDCSLFVTYAENYSVTKQDKKEFVTILEKVIAIDPYNNEELYLTNIIAQSRAEWLLGQIDELFY